MAVPACPTLTNLSEVDRASRNTRVSSLSDKFSGTGHPAKAHNTSALFEILFEAGKTATPSIFVLSHAITRSIILLVIYTWLNASTTKSFEQ